MFDKKAITIIFLAGLIFFSSAALVFFLAGQTGDEARVNQAYPADDLKNIYPELSDAQINFYTETATNGSILSCPGRADENVCVSSVAFIKGDSNICHNLENNRSLYQQCFKTVSKKNTGIEIGKCELLIGDDYYNCLGRVFSIYQEVKDCAGLTEAGARSVCRDIFNYKTVYLNYNRESCRTIGDEKLNQYCLKNIIDKNQDTDGDGLTDLEEINKYKTSYLFADSDSDGINDGEAVKRGLIKAR